MRIQVEYQDLYMAGNRLQTLSQEYSSLLNQIVMTMQQLQAGWMGNDSQAFLSQLEGLRPQLMMLQEAIQTYGQQLSASANAYEQLQMQRAANARLL